MFALIKVYVRAVANMLMRDSCSSAWHYTRTGKTSRCVFHMGANSSRRLHGRWGRKVLLITWETFFSLGAIPVAVACCSWKRRSCGFLSLAESLSWVRGTGLECSTLKMSLLPFVRAHPGRKRVRTACVRACSDSEGVRVWLCRRDCETPGWSAKGSRAPRGRRKSAEIVTAHPSAAWTGVCL